MVSISFLAHLYNRLKMLILFLFFHHLKLLAVYACDGYAHATNVHDETAVAVYSDDVTFEAGEEAGGDAQLDVVARIVFEWMEEETDAVGRDLQYAHERLHNVVRDDGGEMRAAIVYEMVVGECGGEVLPQRFRRALQED